MDIEERVQRLDDKIDLLRDRISGEFKNIAHTLGSLEANVEKCKPKSKVWDAATIKMIAAVIAAVLGSMGIAGFSASCANPTNNGGPDSGPDTETEVNQ
jgi:hypothetical protein